MADFGQNAVVACCSLLLAAGFGAAIILNKRKNESTQHGLNHTSESENLLERSAYNALLLELATFCTALIEFSFLTVISIKFCSSIM